MRTEPDLNGIGRGGNAAAPNACLLLFGRNQALATLDL